MTRHVPSWKGGRRAFRYVTPGVSYYTGRERESSARKINGMEIYTYMYKYVGPGARAV